MAATDSDWREKFDSNALVLPAKKKSKAKAKKQLRVKPSANRDSQNRKLNKLKEEKMSADLLADCIRTIDKYKIQEDAYSLLKPSGKIGQVETLREKRKRTAQLSKLGLETPQYDRPSKKSAKKCKLFEVESWKQESYPDNVLHGKRYQDNASCSSLGSQVTECSIDEDSEPDSPLSDQEFASTNNICVIQGNSNNFSATQCNHERNPRTKAQGMEFNDPKVDCEISSINVDPTAPKPLFPTTVVHISRPPDIDEKRKDLPIVMMEQEIMEAINEHSTVIICGETGCGKTTQVPQFLYEAGFGSRKCDIRGGIIGITQPRRVAVLATAKRVAFEMGLHLGKEIGYQVKHDKKIGENCSIKFMTDGILLRELQSDVILKRYSVIIIDEAHERSVHTDVLIGMLIRVIELRRALHQEQQEKLVSGVCVCSENMVFPLKLVLMSATLQVEDFVSQKKLFSDIPPVIEVPARQYPVTIHFSKRTRVDYMGQAYKKVMAIHKSCPPGGILVFVTGYREVEDLCSKLRCASIELTYLRSSQARVNKITVASETNPIQLGLDIKEANNEVVIDDNCSNQDVDWFNSYEVDSDFANEAASSFSDSELDIDDDDTVDNGRFTDHQTPEKGKIGDVQGDAGSLSALKAAFDSLTGTVQSRSDSLSDLSDVLVSGDCLKLTPISENRCQNPTAPCSVGLHVLPLYAMLSARAQLRVFEEVEVGKRLVVVATNVAETSLTIPGIKYVVDTGKEKIKEYNFENGVERYEIEWISKASAGQRAGRAGRTGPGHCYRLYSSAAFTNYFLDFSSPQISKVPVAGVVLLLKSMGFTKVTSFPFPTPPDSVALREAEKCLKALHAVDVEGRITSLGRAMAQFPISPRISRMLLTFIQLMANMQGYSRANVVFGYAVAASAAFSSENPFIAHLREKKCDIDGLENEKSDYIDQSKKVDDMRKKLTKRSKIAFEKICNRSSDILSVTNLLQLFELAAERVQFCNENALNLKTMEEMSKQRKYILYLVFSGRSTVSSQPESLWTHGTLEDVEKAWKDSADNHHLLWYEEELLGQAICAGWVDKVAKRIRGASKSSDGSRRSLGILYQACGVEGKVYLDRRSSLARAPPDFLVYKELLQARQPYMHHYVREATSVKANWLFKYAQDHCTFSVPADPNIHYEPLTDQIMHWVVPCFSNLGELPLQTMPYVVDDSRRVCVFAHALLVGQVLPCLKTVEKFLAAPPASILKKEAWCQPRIRNLLHKLEKGSVIIYSRTRLKDLWNENPGELHSEIMNWFQKKFHHQFENLWVQMHHEIVLDPEDLYPSKVLKEKKLIKRLSV